MEEILAALPHLTASQVYHALSYYQNHREEIHQLIQAAQPEQVIADQSLQVREVAEGVAEVHDEAGRW